MRKKKSSKGKITNNKRKKSYPKKQSKTETKLQDPFSLIMFIKIRLSQDIWFKR